jgi:hypothetical protein
MQRLEQESAKSNLAGAIRYTLGHWHGLTVFLTDGRVEVDTNVVERTMRAIALGRRNSLFAGSTRGAEAWAILASIVSTAKLHELDPQTYLADVLEKIVSGQTKMNALHGLPRFQCSPRSIGVDAEEARLRARHFRWLARDLIDDRLREKLLDLAKQYDQAAEAMEGDEASEWDHGGFQR